MLPNYRNREQQCALPYCEGTLAEPLDLGQKLHPVQGDGMGDHFDFPPRILKSSDQSYRFMPVRKVDTGGWDHRLPRAL